jgi:hypothetical protein
MGGKRVSVNPRPLSRNETFADDDKLESYFTAELATAAIIGTRGSRIPAITQDMWMHLIF